jgi:hypothetical protein
MSTMFVIAVPIREVWTIKTWFLTNAIMEMTRVTILLLKLVQGQRDGKVAMYSPESHNDSGGGQTSKP